MTPKLKALAEQIIAEQDNEFLKNNPAWNRLVQTTKLILAADDRRRAVQVCDATKMKR